MLAALLLAAAAARTSGVDWLALPIASYNSDDGLAGGVVAQAQWFGRAQPYKAALGAQILFSTAGVQSHYLRLDVPRLFGTPVRLLVGAEYHKELYSPYYGLGNSTSAEVADYRGLSGEHPFSYGRRYPQGSIAFTLPLNDSGVRLLAFSRYLRLHTEAYPGSLFAQQPPPGAEGGEELSFGAGVLVDHRQGEAVPTGGFLLEAAVRGAGRGVASEHSYVGVTGRALGFLPIFSRIVLATRVEGDALSAGTPFFELARFGGVDPLEGVGGERSVRGIPRNRYIGRFKALATAELRVRIADARLLDRSVSFGMVGFIDTGKVWQLQPGDGRPFDVHSGGGGGLRMWHREFVVRLDVGTSRERAVNFYITFGNFF